MSTKSLVAVVGLGLTAEVLRRHITQSTTTIPAVVSAAAERALAGLAVDPCGSSSARETDFTRLYVAQKEALIAKHGGAMEKVCSKNIVGMGFGLCVPNPFKQIPTAPAGCTVKVAQQWISVARSLAASAETVTSLRADLTELAAALELQANLVRTAPAAGPTDADLNGRIWSNIARLSIALAGVHINHGDAEVEASTELVRTVTDPGSYLTVATDVLGAAAGLVLGSNLGAFLIVGGAAYAVWRYT